MHDTNEAPAQAAAAPEPALSRRDLLKIGAAAAVFAGGAAAGLRLLANFLAWQPAA